MKTIKRLIYTILMLLAPNKKKYIICNFFYKVNFGENVRITGFPKWASEPYLISIGNNVTITQNVVFHTHDGGVHVLRKQNPGLNIFGKIIIGDNVFIGSNTIILPNIKVGNNVVIGSGSVITKDIPENSVVVGVPARVIKTIEEYKIDALKKGVIVPNNLKGKKREVFIQNIFDNENSNLY